MKNYAYVLGALHARFKLGYDMEGGDLEQMLEAAVSDEVKGVEEYEDLATTARDEGHAQMAKLLESHADDESRHAKEDAKALNEAD